MTKFIKRVLENFHSCCIFKLKRNEVQILAHPSFNSTLQTALFTQQHNKPYRIVQMDGNGRLRDCMFGFRLTIFGYVARPRENIRLGIYQLSYAFFDQLIN